MSSSPLKYLAGYPAHLVAQIQAFIGQERLGELLLRQYPKAHDVRTDRAVALLKDLRGH